MEKLNEGNGNLGHRELVTTLLMYVVVQCPIVQLDINKPLFLKGFLGFIEKLDIRVLDMSNFTVSNFWGDLK